MSDLMITLNSSDLVDDETLLDYARDVLEMPSDSMWWNSDMFSTHSYVFATPDPDLTDEYLMDYSNYCVAYDLLSAEFPDDVEEGSFGHWTYSRFVCIKIRVIDDEGVITPAFIRAVELVEGLRDYPLLDDSDYLEREQKLNDEYIQRCFDAALADEAVPDGVSVDDVYQAMWALDIYIEQFWISDEDWASIMERADYEAQERRILAHGGVPMF
jgi:hypothetical protein